MCQMFEHCSLLTAQSAGFTIVHTRLYSCGLDHDKLVYLCIRQQRMYDLLMIKASSSITALTQLAKV